VEDQQGYAVFHVARKRRSGAVPASARSARDMKALAGAWDFS
jgi:hypothetical protein